MHLGLIAMSGVRVQNKALLELGLTLPGFVQRSKVIATLPSLSLLTLAGMTPSEIRVSYLEVPDRSSVMSSFTATKFTIVPRSSMMGLIEARSQNSSPDFFRLQNSPVQVFPVRMVFQSVA